MADSFLEELVDDLVNEGTVSAKGTDAFFGQMPDNGESPCVAVFDNGGAGAGMHNPRGKYGVLFRVRAANYTTARNTAADIYNRYHAIVNETLENTRILAALGDTYPQHVGEDVNRRHIVVLPMTFTVVAQETEQDDDGYGGGKDPGYIDVVA